MLFTVLIGIFVYVIIPVICILAVIYISFEFPFEWLRTLFARKTVDVSLSVKEEDEWEARWAAREESSRYLEPKHDEPTPESFMEFEDDDYDDDYDYGDDYCASCGDCTRDIRPKDGSKGNTETAGDEKSEEKPRRAALKSVTDTPAGVFKPHSLADEVEELGVLLSYDNTVEAGMRKEIAERKKIDQNQDDRGHEDKILNTRLPFAEAITRTYPYLSVSVAADLLNQFDMLAEHIANKESINMKSVRFMAHTLVYFNPGTAILIGNTLSGVLDQMSGITGASRLHSLVDSIIFYRHWIKAHIGGRIKPLYDEYGVAQKGMLVAHFANKEFDADDPDDPVREPEKWEPTTEERATLKKLNFKSWLQ